MGQLIGVLKSGGKIGGKLEPERGGGGLSPGEAGQVGVDGVGADGQIFGGGVDVGGVFLGVLGYFVQTGGQTGDVLGRALFGDKGADGAVIDDRAVDAHQPGG